MLIEKRSRVEEIELLKLSPGELKKAIGGNKVLARRLRDRKKCLVSNEVEETVNKLLSIIIIDWFPPRGNNGMISWRNFKSEAHLMAYIQMEASVFYGKEKNITWDRMLEKGFSWLRVGANKYYPGKWQQVVRDLKLVTPSTTPIAKDSNGRFIWREYKGLDVIKNVIEVFASNLTIDVPYLSYVYLNSNGHSRYTYAISKYYPGGIDALNQKLFGKSNPNRPRKYWMDLNKIEEQAKILLSKGVELKKNVLYKSSESGFHTAVVKYYPGGLGALRRSIGISYGTKYKGYWTQQTIIDEATQFFKLEGELSQKLLAQRGRHDLLNAIKKFPGGLKGLKIYLNSLLNIDSDITISEANRNLEKLFED